MESKIINDFSPPVLTKTKSYAVTTILGQNIINCRLFSLETQKQFSFLGSYKSTSRFQYIHAQRLLFWEGQMSGKLIKGVFRKRKQAALSEFLT